MGLGGTKVTGEDKKLILEFCGIKYESYDSPMCPNVGGAWVDSSGKYANSMDPTLDPNFYFKYAVPKLEVLSILYQPPMDISVMVASKSGRFVAEDKDPAEAFGQALLKVIKENK